MKSVITKRWYFVFLVFVLSIHTFLTFKSIMEYRYWKHPYWLSFSTALFQLIVWYCIIKMHPKLWLAIVVLVSLVLLDTLFELPYLSSHLNDGWILFQFLLYIMPFLVLVIAGKRYITVQEKSNLTENISDKMKNIITNKTYLLFLSCMIGVGIYIGSGRFVYVLFVKISDFKIFSTIASLMVFGLASSLIYFILKESKYLSMMIIIYATFMLIINLFELAYLLTHWDPDFIDKYRSAKKILNPLQTGLWIVLYAFLILGSRKYITHIQTQDENISQ